MKCVCVCVDDDYIYICGRQNKGKRHDRAIISINTFNDILTVNRRKRKAIGPKFDKICGLTGNPSIDHRE